MFMFSNKFSQFIFQPFSRTFSSKRTTYRYISPILRFHMDTKSVYGSQRMIREERSTKPTEFNLCNIDSKKEIFEKDTEQLYASSNGFHRACSLPKGISIMERQKYLRNLFRIPRGQLASLYPQAYIPNKYLGVRRKK